MLSSGREYYKAAMMAAGRMMTETEEGESSRLPKFVYDGIASVSADGELVIRTRSHFQEGWRIKGSGYPKGKPN